MKLSSLRVKKNESFHIDIHQPNQCNLMVREDEDLEGIVLLFDERLIQLKGYYPHDGYLWFIFEAIKKGTTGISFLCSKLDINHYVLVIAE